LEEELGWARLEWQKTLDLSAEADDAIWHLASLARRRMQERDEARNQARMLLADLQARNARMMALPGTSYSRVARPDVFAATAHRLQAQPGSCSGVQASRRYDDAGAACPCRNWLLRCVVQRLWQQEHRFVSGRLCCSAVSNWLRFLEAGSLRS